MENNGRPEFTDEQYQSWLDAMRPFLENSNSLYYSLSQAGLSAHKDVIYRKYRLKDWFCEKIDQLRATPGELVNDGIVSLIRNTVDKIKRKETPPKEELDMLKFYAEKSRAAQPFFVNRTETAPAKPIEELLEELNNKPDTIDDVAETFAKQGVETNPPVQNQEQGGQTGSVSTEPNATQTPN